MERAFKDGEIHHEFAEEVPAGDGHQLHDAAIGEIDDPEDLLSPEELDQVYHRIVSELKKKRLSKKQRERLEENLFNKR